MKTLIAIPCMDMLHTDFARSLVGLQLDGAVQFTFAQASLIYDARNNLANIAIENGFDRVLWLDSDMQFEPDLFRRLSADLDEGRACVSALYFSRKPPRIKPVIYSGCQVDAQGVPFATSITEWPEAEVFPVAACGFGAVMTTTELLRKVRDKYGLPFSPVLGFGEDLSFCLRVTELGEQIFCDSRVRPGHVGLCVFDETIYRAQKGGNGGTT